MIISTSKINKKYKRISLFRIFYDAYFGGVIRGVILFLATYLLFLIFYIYIYTRYIIRVV